MSRVFHRISSARLKYALTSWAGHLALPVILILKLVGFCVMAGSLSSCVVYNSQWLAEKLVSPPEIADAKFGARLIEWRNPEAKSDCVRLEICLFGKKSIHKEVLFRALTAITPGGMYRLIDDRDDTHRRIAFEEPMRRHEWDRTDYGVRGPFTEAFFAYDIPLEAVTGGPGKVRANLRGELIGIDGTVSKFDFWIGWKVYRRRGIYIIAPGGASDLFGRGVKLHGDDFQYESYEVK